MEDNREQEELLKKIDEYKRIAEEAMEGLDEMIEVLNEEMEEFGEEDLDDDADWIIIF